MEIHSEKDFPKLRDQYAEWRTRFSMFSRDVRRIQDAIESHITAYSKHLVNYRQTKSKRYLENAQVEIDEINRILKTVEKIELMALLSKG
jgi:hypothetical protein